MSWLNPPPARPDFNEWFVATARKGGVAVERHRVGRVVVLSSMGAQNGSGTGPVGVLLDIERAFEAAAPHVLVLRPGFFMENLLPCLGTVASQGTIYLPVPADENRGLSLCSQPARAQGQGGARSRMGLA